MGIPLPKQTPRVSTNEKLTAKQLKTWMNKNGFSNREFAELLGVTENAVKLWISGQRDFSVTNSRLVRMFMKYPKLVKEF